VVRADDAPLVEWRPGVRTRLHAADASSPAAFCVIEQWCEPGTGAPKHTHFAVEEMILVLAGEAEVQLDGATAQLRAGDSILLPAHSWHGFTSVGTETLHTIAVFAMARPPVCYEHEPHVVLEVGGTGPVMVDAHRSVSG
jgi:quercetin dioxygenase-like cupin family protein